MGVIFAVDGGVVVVVVVADIIVIVVMESYVSAMTVVALVAMSHCKSMACSWLKRVSVSDKISNCNMGTYWCHLSHHSTCKVSLGDR